MPLMYYKHNANTLENAKTRSRLKLLALLLPLILFLLFSAPCAANPINPDFPLSNRGDLFLLLWLICPLIEASVVISILWRRFTSGKAKIVSFVLIYILNLVTIPITALLAHPLLQKDNPNRVYLAEWFPLVAEFLALWLLFTVLRKRGSLAAPVKPFHIFLLTFGVNLLTFLVGFFFYRYWPSPATPYPVNWHWF